MKTRHGIVSFWLWMMIIFNVVYAMIILLNKNLLNNSVLALLYLIAMPLLNIAGASLILNWKKIGYWLVVVSSVWILPMIIFSDTNGELDEMVIIKVLSPIVLLAILHIKKDGVSCWENLSNNSDRTTD